jgi:WhiB family redox-sensing transcriptional regulator
MTRPTTQPTSEPYATDWRQRAACREKDPELFFPIGTSGPAIDQANEAKTVCMRCMVRPDCLDWALTTGQDAGVWGGLTEDERRKLRRRHSTPRPDRQRTVRAKARQPGRPKKNPRTNAATTAQERAS